MFTTQFNKFLLTHLLHKNPNTLSWDLKLFHICSLHMIHFIIRLYPMGPLNTFDSNYRFSSFFPPSCWRTSNLIFLKTSPLLSRLSFSLRRVRFPSFAHGIFKWLAYYLPSSWCHANHMFATFQVNTSAYTAAVLFLCLRIERVGPRGYRLEEMEADF